MNYQLVKYLGKKYLSIFEIVSHIFTEVSSSSSSSSEEEEEEEEDQ